MSEKKFYLCKHCGNLITMIHASGVVPFCCGEQMQELIPGSVDAAQEKHVPVVKVEGDTVTVTIGSVIHPALEEHHIEWIYLQTEKGGQLKYIPVGEKPEAVFTLCDDKPVAAFEYCNLHGLWKKEI